MLQAFLQPEQLDVNEQWQCGRCKSRVQAAKKLDLWNFPEVLILQLKRFASGRSLSDKLTAKVDFPLRGLTFESPV
jgi:ubiquitin carboxyl-terminal hydrolase 4/11